MLAKEMLVVQLARQRLRLRIDRQRMRRHARDVFEGDGVVDRVGRVAPQANGP